MVVGHLSAPVPVRAKIRGCQFALLLKCWWDEVYIGGYDYIRARSFCDTMDVVAPFEPSGTRIYKYPYYLLLAILGPPYVLFSTCFSASKTLAPSTLEATVGSSTFSLN